MGPICGEKMSRVVSASSERKLSFLAIMLNLRGKIYSNKEPTLKKSVIKEFYQSVTARFNHSTNINEVE